MLLFAWPAGSARAGETRRPNVVVIFADDLGYGDLGCYGHPTIRTPNLDRMAGQGMRFTQFYSAASVCSPSRAALLTGRLPIRSGVNLVLFPRSGGGLPDSEVTLPTLLKQAGYRTMAIGKWHLGHHVRFLPTRRGFDRYYGIPYSNDMALDPAAAKFAPDCTFREGQTAERARTDKPVGHKVPLMRGEQVVEYPADQTTLTKRYTEEAVKFIKGRGQEPFFLYLAHTMPHIPLFASDAFRGKTRRGLYGDVIEELDWSVGEILRALRDEGIAEDTLVVFTSDNGPWLIQNLRGGSAGLLRGGKFSGWEGGFREPGIFWWPTKIRPGTVNTELGSTLDLLPTVAKLAGAKLPTDRVLDGHDLGPTLFGTGPSPRTRMFFYRGTELYGYRKGPWKVHLKSHPGYGKEAVKTHNPPLLFHLDRDPSERFDVAAENPEIVADLLRDIDAHRKDMKPGVPQR
jgi:arylsulfatase A-like enzyme